MKAGEAHNNCLSSRKTSITYVLYAHLCERVCVCVCVRVCVFIHGHERIGHAQLVVAAVGVLPASGPPFLEQTYVSATSLPVGNNLCATFILITEPWPPERKCASACASLNLQNYTVDNLPDIQRPLLRNPTRLLHRLWPHIGIPEPLASSRTFHPSLSSKGLWIRETSRNIFFFLNHPRLAIFKEPDAMLGPSL